MIEVLFKNASITIGSITLQLNRLQLNRLQLNRLQLISFLNRLQLISFLNSHFPRLFTGCHAFLQKQMFNKGLVTKTRPELEFLLL